MKSGLFTLSIDDGHPLDHRFAEYLNRYDIPATFYVPLHNSEGHPVLNIQTLRELAHNFEIGAHTLDHKALTQLSPKKAWEQINQGKAQLEDRLGHAIQGFSYPLGEQHRIHRKMVQAAGFYYARTSHNLLLETGQDRYALPTSLQFFPHHRQILIRNYFMQGQLSKRYAALKICLDTNCLITRVINLFDFAMREEQVFHLWCHSLDIENHQLWNNLETILRHIAEHTTCAQRLTNAELAHIFLSQKITNVKQSEFA